MLYLPADKLVNCYILKLYDYSENFSERENVLPSVNQGEVEINKINNFQQQKQQMLFTGRGP